MRFDDNDNIHYDDVIVDSNCHGQNLYHHVVHWVDRVHRLCLDNLDSRCCYYYWPSSFYIVPMYVYFLGE